MEAAADRARVGTRGRRGGGLQFPECVSRRGGYGVNQDDKHTIYHVDSNVAVAGAHRKPRVVENVLPRPCSLPFHDRRTRRNRNKFGSRRTTLATRAPQKKKKV